MAVFNTNENRIIYTPPPPCSSVNSIYLRQFKFSFFRKKSRVSAFAGITVFLYITIRSVL